VRGTHDAETGIETIEENAVVIIVSKKPLKNFEYVI